MMITRTTHTTSPNTPSATCCPTSKRSIEMAAPIRMNAAWLCCRGLMSTCRQRRISARYPLATASQTANALQALIDAGVEPSGLTLFVEDLRKEIGLRTLRPSHFPTFNERTPARGRRKRRRERFGTVCRPTRRAGKDRHYARAWCLMSGTSNVGSLLHRHGKQNCFSGSVASPAAFFCVPVREHAAEVTAVSTRGRAWPLRLSLARRLLSSNPLGATPSRPEPLVADRHPTPSIPPVGSYIPEDVARVSSVALKLQAGHPRHFRGTVASWASGRHRASQQQPRSRSPSRDAAAQVHRNPGPRPSGTRARRTAATSSSRRSYKTDTSPQHSAPPYERSSPQTLAHDQLARWTATSTGSRSRLRTMAQVSPGTRRPAPSPLLT
jgi:hypothetical protein